MGRENVGSDGNASVSVICAEPCSAMKSMIAAAKMLFVSISIVLLYVIVCRPSTHHDHLPCLHEPSR